MGLFKFLFGNNKGSDDITENEDYNNEEYEEREEELWTCAGCSKDFPKYDLIEVCDDYYCEYCIDANVRRCDRCHTYYPIEKIIYIEHSGDNYCIYCMEDLKDMSAYADEWLRENDLGDSPWSD